MADKNLKTEYDKKKVQVKLQLNFKEKTILDSMMENDGWQNTAGFIKDRLFGVSKDAKYAKILQESKVEDYKKIIINLITEMNNVLGYLNYRFTYELDRIDRDEKEEEKKKAKAQKLMREWKSAVLLRTEEMSTSIRSILHILGIKAEKEHEDAVRYAPDSVLEKAASNWNDINSPEIHELVRRQHARIRQKMKRNDN